MKFDWCLKARSAEILGYGRGFRHLKMERAKGFEPSTFTLAR
jgi:hypothetical protein